MAHKKQSHYAPQLQSNKFEQSPKARVIIDQLIAIWFINEIIKPAKNYYYYYYY